MHTVTTIPELHAVLRRRAIDVVLLDPLAPGVGDTQALGPCLARHADVPVIGYVSVSPAGMRQAMTLATLGVRRVVLRGYDDQPAAFRALLEATYADTLAAQVLKDLAGALARLPDTLARAIEALFQAPHAFRTAGDLARAAGLPPRTCSRLLSRAGLATARSFVSAARVVRAYHALRSGHARVIDVTRRLGYGTPDALVRDARRSTGLRPAVLARRVPPDVLAGQIVCRLSTRVAPRPRLAVVAGGSRVGTSVTRPALPQPASA